MSLKDHILIGKSIAGPDKLNFDRNKIYKFIETSNASPEDIRIANSALFFDQLLSSLRELENLKQTGLKRNILFKALISTATFYSLELGDIQFNSIDEKINKDGGYSTSDLQKKLVKGVNGIEYSVDEYISGVGDALTIILKQIQNRSFDKGSNYLSEIDQDLLRNLKVELDIATSYIITTDWWNECLRNSYEIIELPDSIAIVPTDVDQDKNRAISSYRRNHLFLIDSIEFGKLWFYSLDSNSREKICSIKLVTKVSITNDSIEEITLGYNREALDAAGVFIQQEKSIEAGPLVSFLDIEFSKESGVTIRRLIQAWRFLVSLSNALTQPLKKTTSLSSVLDYAPNISNDLLTLRLSEALYVDIAVAKNLIDTLTFSAKKSKELWFQPLIEFDQRNFLLATPCTIAPRLDRIIEAWLEIGGISLEERGKPFEKYVINYLSSTAINSPISNHIQVCKKEIKLKSIDPNVGEIDVLVSIGDIVLIIECKCIKWPEGSIAHSNYYKRVNEGVRKQLDIRIKTIESDREKFRSLAKAENFLIPENFKLIPILMVNTPTSVGLKIGKSYVIDISILLHYFLNSYIKFEESKGAKTYREHPITFYDDIESAQENLVSYLNSPPQLSDLSEAVKIRHINQGSIGNKKITFITHDVDLDTEKVMKKYGISSQPVST